MFKGFVSAVGFLTICLIAASVVLFIVLNMMVQCDDWSESRCITVGEFIIIFTPK